MYRLFVAVALLGLLVAAEGASDAHAAPFCYRSYAPTYDMAGAYYAAGIDAYIEVNACGGMQITWEDHRYPGSVYSAWYYATDRIPGGGFIAKGDQANGGYWPNGSTVVGIKPGVRGMIELATFDEYVNITAIHALRKIR